VLLSGCGTTPPPAPPLSASYSIARDGYLHYRLPVGWFDVTADSQAHGNTVWLLRSDYAATITVNEIHVDAVARKEIERQGLSALAQLTMSLSGQDKGTVLQNAPEEFELRGHPACSYEVETPSTGDAMRVVLLDAGEKIYAVAALRTGGKNDASSLAAIQMQFLEELRW
jgi:hypothetical protein